MNEIQALFPRMRADLDTAAIIYYFSQRPESSWHETAVEMLYTTEDYKPEELEQRIKEIIREEQNEIY